MIDINKLYKLEDLAMSVHYYAQQALGLMEGDSTILAMLKLVIQQQGDVLDFNLLAEAIIQDKMLNDFCIKAGLIVDGKIESTVSQLILMQLGERLTNLDLLNYYNRYNPLYETYFSDEVVSAIKDNLSRFRKGKIQPHDQYKIYNTSGSHRSFCVCSVDIKRQWGFFETSSEDKKNKILQKDLSYKIFNDIDPFLSSVYNYLQYTMKRVGEFHIAPAVNRLVVLPILGYTQIECDDEIFWVQVCPHVFVSGVSEGMIQMEPEPYLEMARKGLRAPDIDPLQMIYELDDNIISARSCVLANGAVATEVDTIFPLIQYTLDDYNDQLLLLDLGSKFILKGESNLPLIGMTNYEIKGQDTIEEVNGIDPNDKITAEDVSATKWG